MGNISIDITIPTLNYNRSETLTQFYNDIRKYPTLSKSEEIELFRQKKFGTKAEASQARTRIINSNLRFVVSVAKKYANKNNLVDLINEGNIGLVEAVDRFDYSRDNRFMSYAVHYIHRDILAHMRSASTMINKRPIAKLNGPIKEIKADYMKNEERMPSNEEIKMELKDRYNIEANNFEDTHFSSIDDSPDENANFVSYGILQEYQESTGSTNSYIHKMNNDYNKQIANVLLSHTRSKRDREIIKMKYGIGYQRQFSNHEIAKKLNLTTERVRQIDEESIKRFRAICNSHNIKAVF